MEKSRPQKDWVAHHEAAFNTAAVLGVTRHLRGKDTVSDDPIEPWRRVGDELVAMPDEWFDVGRRQQLAELSAVGLGLPRDFGRLGQDAAIPVTPEVAVLDQRGSFQMARCCVSADWDIFKSAVSWATVGSSLSSASRVVPPFGSAKELLLRGRATKPWHSQA